MSTRSNNLVNPNAREAMNRFKMEAAGEVGVKHGGAVALLRQTGRQQRADERLADPALAADDADNLLYRRELIWFFHLDFG